MKSLFLKIKNILNWKFIQNNNMKHRRIEFQNCFGQVSLNMFQYNCIIWRLCNHYNNHRHQNNLVQHDTYMIHLNTLSRTILYVNISDLTYYIFYKDFILSSNWFKYTLVILTFSAINILRTTWSNSKLQKLPQTAQTFNSMPNIKHIRLSP